MHKTIIDVKFRIFQLQMLTKLFLLVLIFMSIGGFAQELDEQFLKSLPEDIRNDLIASTNDQSTDTVQTKDYESFDSNVESILLIMSFKWYLEYSSL